MLPLETMSAINRNCERYYLKSPNTIDTYAYQTCLIVTQWPLGVPLTRNPVRFIAARETEHHSPAWVRPITKTRTDDLLRQPSKTSFFRSECILISKATYRLHQRLTHMKGVDHVIVAHGLVYLLSSPRIRIYCNLTAIGCVD